MEQWLTMSNVCRPVDPRRSFAEVLKIVPVNMKLLAHFCQTFAKVRLVNCQRLKFKVKSSKYARRRQV